MVREIYIIVVLDKIDDVGRVFGELADSAALYQLAQFTIDRDLVPRHGEDDDDVGLGNLVRQLTDRRVVLHRDITRTHPIMQINITTYFCPVPMDWNEDRAACSICFME